mmetsp:Transcript_57663/g.70470  ORF Transcript_57663/g.70470 Transcript_57663/m.70470 type:complete len:174 (+) Transcript_57663:81-602(+)
MPLFSKIPQIRPWPEFFETTKFEKPKNPQERIATNLSYYIGNYLLLFAVFFAFTCIINIALLITMILVVVGGYFLKDYFKKELDKLSSKKKKNKKKEQQKIAKYYVFGSLGIISLVGNIALISCIILSIAVIIFHAFFRKRNLKSKAVHWMDVYQDFGPLSYITDLIASNIDE